MYFCHIDTVLWLLTLNVNVHKLSMYIYNLKFFFSGDLKKRLELICGIPICRQQISGLGGSRATSTATLSSLGLQRNAVLRLKAADRVMADDEYVMLVII